MNKTLRAAIYTKLATSAVSLPAFAAAQIPDPLATPPAPAEKYTVSAGGVDMRTGQYSFSVADLPSSIPGGAALERNAGSNDFHIWQPMGRFSHNWHIYLSYTPIKNGQASFSVGGARGYQFIAVNSNNFTTRSSDYQHALQAFPTGTGATQRYMVYKGPDGEKITFRPQATVSDRANRGQVRGGTSFYASKIEQPNGVTYTLTYDEPTSSTPAFLRRVTSNTGSVLIFEWVSNPVDKFISKACLFNAAIETVPTTNSCATSTYTASYTYGANGHMASATDAAGATSTYVSSFGQSAADASPNNYSWTNKFYDPGSATPYLTNTMHRNLFVEYVESQDFAEGPDYAYSWIVVEHNETTMEVAGGTATRSDSATVTVNYQSMRRPYENYPDSFVISSGPSRVVDELGRQQTANYCTGGPGGGGCAYTWLKYWKHPEGNQAVYAYNLYGKPTSIVSQAKTGSSDASITTSYTYYCSSIRCDPSSMTDGNNGTTNATYSSVHGGMLQRTSPADANGIRPETRYTYAQKYAWLKSGASYSQAATPVWVLASEEYCKTSAADASGNCAAGAADEVVTTYEYQQGSSAKGSNILLLGSAVTADGQTLRTCYGYDVQGRKISETKPSANLTSCP